MREIGGNHNRILAGPRSGFLALTAALTLIVHDASAANVTTHTPPADILQSLPLGSGLKDMYWQSVRATISPHADTPADSARVESAVARIKTMVTPTSCHLISPRWHADLQVLQATLGCEMIRQGPNLPNSQKSTRESVEVTLTRGADGWELVLKPSDRVACAQARRKDDRRSWLSYQQTYPGGMCQSQAIERTMPAAQALKVIKGETGFQFSTDGRELYSYRALSDGTTRIIVRDDQGDLVRSHDIHTPDPADAVIISASGQHVLSRHNRQLLLHDLREGSTVALDLQPYSPATSPDCGFAMALDSLRARATLVTCVTRTKTKKEAGNEMKSVQKPAQAPGARNASVALAPGAGTLNVAPTGSDVQLSVTTIPIADSAEATGFAIDGHLDLFTLSPSGSRLLVVQNNGTDRPQRAAMYDTTTGAVLWTETITDAYSGRVLDATWSSQGEIIAISTDHTTQLLDIGNGQHIELPRQGSRLINKRLALSDDGKRFLMHDTDYKWVTVYDVNHDKNVFRYDYGKGDAQARAAQPTARVFIGPNARSGLFLIQEHSQATLFQINDIGVKRVVIDGMDPW